MYKSCFAPTVAHNFTLSKIGAEQIYGKPMRNDKININFKAFRFVLFGNGVIFITTEGNCVPYFRIDKENIY